MSDESIHQPHDKLFKQGFSDPANAAGFLRHQFPDTIAREIDWTGLALEPGSFVDSHYRLHESDLLFSTRFKDRECRLYLLFEHQSSEDPIIALRLLRYMVRIWEGFLKSAPGSALPVVLPVVIAQSDKAWKISTRFSDLLDLPVGLEKDLVPYLPDFSFQLVQLAEMPYEAIAGTPEGILLLRVMKAERSDGLLADPVWDEALLARIPRAFFEMLLRYLLDADVDSEGFERRLGVISQSELKDSAMTLAQQLHQKGLEKGLESGLEKGRQEGRQEDILEALSIRFGSVPSGLAEKVKGIETESRLRDLHRAAIRSASLEEFASGL